MRLAADRLPLGPVSIGALHAIVVERLGTVLSRPRLRRLHELSAGNPYLALELIRATQAGTLQLDTAEPPTVDLARLLGARLEALPATTRTALVAAAAASHPTQSLIGRVTGRDAAALLDPAISAGVVTLDETVIRFAHPLLASAAYGGASAEERQRIHATLARTVADREERARHAAFAAVAADERVALRVERAAEMTFRRGAPGAAAELAGLAHQLIQSNGRTQPRAAMSRAGYLSKWVISSPSS